MGCFCRQRKDVSAGYSRSTFWRRPLWDRVGGAVPTHLDFAGDFALWSAFFKHSSPVGIPCPIAGFRSQPLQKTRDIAQYTKEATSVLASLRKKLNWRKPIARQSIAVCACTRSRWQERYYGKWSDIRALSRIASRTTASLQLALDDHALHLNTLGINSHPPLAAKT